jgi:CheY-like chemotaxis protein
MEVSHVVNIKDIEDKHINSSLRDFDVLDAALTGQRFAPTLVMLQPAPVVGILDTNEDTVTMLRIYLERAGFVVVAALTHMLRDGKLDFHQFVTEHEPKVIIYDITIPYDQSYALFQHFSSRPVAREIQFVLTTTNVAHVRAIAGPDLPLHEIVGKPYDLDQIVRAVTQAIGRKAVAEFSDGDRRTAERRTGPHDRRESEDRRS